MGETRRHRCWSLSLAVLGLLLAIAAQGILCEEPEPTESQCRPYIERALKEQHVPTDTDSGEQSTHHHHQEEKAPTDELTDSAEEDDDSKNRDNDSEDKGNDNDVSREGTNDSGEETEETKTAETGSVEEESGEEADKDTNEEHESAEETGESLEAGEPGTEETGSEEQGETTEGDTNEEESVEGDTAEEEVQGDASIEGDTAEEQDEIASEEGDTAEEVGGASVDGDTQESVEGDTVEEQDEGADSVERGEESVEGDTKEDDATKEGESEDGDTKEEDEGESVEGDTKEGGESVEGDTKEEEGEESVEGDTKEEEGGESVEGDTKEEEGGESVEGDTTEGESVEGDTKEEDGAESVEGDTKEEGAESIEGDTKEEEGSESTEGDTKEEDGAESVEGDTKEEEGTESVEGDTKEEGGESVEGDTIEEESVEGDTKEEAGGDSVEGDTKEDIKETAQEPSTVEEAGPQDSEEASSKEDSTPEEELTREVVIPDNLRPREHITKILRLDQDSAETESALAKAIDTTLKTLKGLYDNAIKPLEILYKYRDLSNRHFGDPEIFSKPLILFMGPWSGGKSSTINYLLDNEFTHMSLRTGAEPSPAYFNILMHGNEEEILDGTQLAADWTFSGLQKFGQGLLDRLRGVNIVEIPGILEIRKQVQRLFPFNDACQWFIDRADIIFLVYDPAKLDVGPETEAILDQLKGREYQTRIILNKADQVKPEELMRVQGTLIWNISPLMSSMEPPVMYSTSLWSMPYETGAPTRLLLAQERAFLRDLREAIDRRVENKIASARRFAVRVRNHAKMVDCYLTTYYNHKTFFGNRKKISDDIIEYPQRYHIYEGLSTLTNISRYDLPDPDVYRDFFKVNPLYDFTKLSDTCTYFRGCPINKLDIAIAYDLPELVGKYKKALEAAKNTNS